MAYNIPGAKRRKEEDHDSKSLACHYTRSEETACRRSCAHNSKSRSQDYTVIIKWKDWFSLEAQEDAGTDALKRERIQREMVNSECERDQESQNINQGKKSMPILRRSEKESSICDESLDPFDMKLSNQQKCQYSQAIAQHTQADRSTLSRDVDKATMKDEQEKDSFKKPSVSVIKSEDSNACSDASKQLHSSACASDESAQVVHHAACEEETACNSSLKAKPGDSLLKNCIVEEAHDAIVVLDGKVKMSDMKTIYEKSHVIGKQSQRDGYNDAKMMEVQELRLVDYERRTKRLKENAGPSRVSRGANLVKCPICGLTIPGDIHDADFNNQINLHVDSCIGFSK